ncbi:MAG: hypothetical protein ACXVBJ_11715, partial [Flavisolibacter sp.]
DRPIKNVILVQESDDDDPGRTREKPWFDSIALVGKNTNPYSREVGTSVYLLAGARVNINSIISKEIDSHRYH